jgi:putative ABC transport system ATP-binding protein
VDTARAASAAGPLVQMRGIRKEYGRGAATVAALAGIDLEIRRGEMVALVGPSGSGKSTLMHVLGLLDRPSAGTYLLGGQDVSRLGAKAAARLRGSRVAFVFQAIHLLPSLDALRNIELPMVYGRQPRARRAASAREALQRVGLAHLAHRYPAELSGGQAQRVAIARAVAPGPALLLADEPTGALDRRSGRTVLRLFQDLHRNLGLTVVLVTHDPFVAQHTERIVQLEDGRITADAPVADRLLAEADEPQPVGGDSRLEEGKPA